MVVSGVFRQVHCCVPAEPCRRKCVSRASVSAPQRQPFRARSSAVEAFPDRVPSFVLEVPCALMNLRPVVDSGLVGGLSHVGSPSMDAQGKRGQCADIDPGMARPTPVAAAGDWHLAVMPVGPEAPGARSGAGLGAIGGILRPGWSLYRGRCGRPPAPGPAPRLATMVHGHRERPRRRGTHRGGSDSRT